MDTAWKYQSPLTRLFLSTELMAMQMQWTYQCYIRGGWHNAEIWHGKNFLIENFSLGQKVGKVKFCRFEWFQFPFNYILHPTLGTRGFSCMLLRSQQKEMWDTKSLRVLSAQEKRLAPKGTASILFADWTVKCRSQGWGWKDRLLHHISPWRK